MQAVLASILALIEEVSSNASVSLIASIISTLEQIIPVLIDVAKDLMPAVTRIINALKSNSAVTPDQLQALKAIEDQYDADFDAAAKAAEAEDVSSGQ